MPRRASTHVDSPAAAGARLRAARVAAGLSQRDLSFPGCTAAYISRIEAGARIPSLQLLRELAQRLSVSAEYLATGGAANPTASDDLLHAELAARTGNVDEARKIYKKILRSADSSVIAAAARAGLGQIAFQSGDHESAIDDLKAVLAEPALPARERAAATDSLARAYAATARYDEALALLEEALARAEDDKVDADQLRFSVLLANLLIDRTNFTRAEEVLAGLLPETRSAVDPVARAGLFWSQSRLHSSQGRPDIAAKYARQAFETLEVTEHTVYTAKALVLLAQLENERGNPREALELYEQALPAISSSGNAYEHGMLLLEKARALSAIGDREGAIGTALESAGLVAASSPVTAGRAFSLAASMANEMGDPSRAAELYELALDLFPVHDRHRVETLTALASLLEQLGRKDEALSLLKEAVQTPSQVVPR